MVGGGSRRDEGSMVINNTNVFAALETLRKKKKSDKERKTKGSSKSQSSQPKEPEPQVFWTPAPLNSTSWADVDDDDDYYATTAPPQSVWGSSEPQQSNDKPSNVVEVGNAIAFVTLARSFYMQIHLKYSLLCSLIPSV